MTLKTALIAEAMGGTMEKKSIGVVWAVNNYTAMNSRSHKKFFDNKKDRNDFITLLIKKVKNYHPIAWIARIDNGRITTIYDDDDLEK